MVAEPSHPAPNRVLVVEDNEHLAFMLRFILERSGYDVVWAPNGRDAERAIANIEPVSAVLLDLMLPYVSGYELIRIIRDDPLWRYVPVIVLSGKVMEEDIVKALDLGANDYVTKPFRPEELLARIRRLVIDNERLQRLR